MSEPRLSVCPSIWSRWIVLFFLRSSAIWLSSGKLSSLRIALFISKYTEPRVSIRSAVTSASRFSRTSATLEETCQETDFEGLHLLPSGTCPPNPTDLLARGRFDQVLQAALERYQSVVIDSPPVLGMADTSLLASHARGVLFVVRLNESRRRGVRSALEQIRASGAETAGLVVNGVPNRSPYGAYDSERPASAPPPSSDG